ncbi:STAS domain-containing protein [Caenorhabditis elegans]|uniref:Anion transporter SULP-5 n=1 Tax=Caenorhabditis elegans TaxID=6239 RepID=O17951_CAEEL|nr:STAS domain-containing protein [Caenorhabditis elegans]AAX34423.1 anion transporter SULP-5 [Caenorhabditis elegans]CAB04607.3 STAS domain-containing protein [Caenorhabditis elegans]|eukprot:NP_505990.3 SULfate Permease family [Caenorhabditis elegans]
MDIPPSTPSTPTMIHVEEEEYDQLRSFYAKKRRAPMNQVEYDEKYGYQKRLKDGGKFKKRSTKVASRYYVPFTSVTNFKIFLLNLFPIFGWLPKYDWKNSLTSDVVGGITVGVLQIPQGIAYAILSRQDPIVGLYTSIYPVFLYIFFGTSKHASLGTFAVVALMTGLAVEREAFIPSDNLNSTLLPGDEALPSPIEVSCALVLGVGLIQFLMGVFRLQFLTTYLSDQLIAGFTTGSAVHVLVSQFKELFGLRGLVKHSGPGYLIRNVYDTVTNLPKANFMCCAISLATMILLHCGKEYINPIMKRKMKSNIPIPWELVAVIISTIFVALIDANELYNVKIVNKIPTGLPELSLPNPNLIPRVLPDAISIAVVVVAVHLSLSKMLAKKYEYEIDAGQELYALSFTAIGGSFFPTFPTSIGLGRTMVGVESGVKTQVATFFSCLFVLSVSLYFGRFLETLPMCVLSAIIVIALKSMLWKLRDLKGIWKLSKIDCCIWMVAFFATVLVDVSEGLLIAIFFALFTTILREQYPKWHLLANVKDTDEFSDTQQYQETIFYKGICIFKFDAPLLFHNVECFKKCIEKVYDEWKKSSEFNFVKEPNAGKGSKFTFEGMHRIAPITEIPLHPGINRDPILPRHFVIDCSGFTFIDLMGVSALKEVFSDLRKKRVQVYFASTKVPVREMFEKCSFFDFVSKENFYPTLRDATGIARLRQTEFGSLDTTSIPEFDEISNVTNNYPTQ